MTDAKSVLREIDVRRVQRLVQTEFADFYEQFDAERISEKQDMRGSLITWAATFLPEVFPDSLQKDLRERVFAVYSAPDYRVQGWYRLLPLEIALFALTGDNWYLKTSLLNMDHHNSSLRGRVYSSLLFVADRLPYDHPELLSRINHFLEAVYFIPEYPLTVFAVTRGSAAAKIEMLQSWLAGHGNPNHNKTWEDLIKQSPTPNPFPPHLLELYQYLAVRFMEASLPSVKVPEPPLPEPQFPALSEKLWQRVSRHPLMQPYVELKET